MIDFTEIMMCYICWMVYSYYRYKSISLFASGRSLDIDSFQFQGERAVGLWLLESSGDKDDMRPHYKFGSDRMI